MSDKNTGSHGIEVRHIDRIVGVFIMGAMIIVIASWFLRLHGLGALEEKLPFYTIVSESFGLAPAGEIDLAGITIGTIKNVTLQDDGTVRIDMDFIDRYKQFLTVGSQLEVESALGVQSLLGGGGLIFHYNAKESTLLEVNTLLAVVEPVDLAAQIAAFDLPGLADQVKSIVNNVEQLTSQLKADQGALFSTLDNVNNITANLADSTSTIPALMTSVSEDVPRIIGNVEALTKRLETKQVPQILSSVEENLASLQTAMDSVSGILTSSEGDIKDIISNAAGATADLNVLLLELQTIVKDVEATTQQLPGVLSRSEDLIDNSVELTDKLNNHWLLGGSGEAEDTIKPWPSIHSIDESPYDETIQ